MIFGWSFAGGRLSLGNAVLEQLSLEMWERNWALPPSERQDQVLRAGPSLWSHGMKAATPPNPLEEAARGFVL